MEPINNTVLSEIIHFIPPFTSGPNSAAPVLNGDAVFGGISLSRHAISLTKKPFPDKLLQLISPNWVLNSNGDFFRIDGQDGLQTWSGDRLHSTARPIGPVSGTQVETLAASAGGGNDQATTTARTWTDVSGKHKTEADFRSMTSGIVTLRKTDGTLITVPMEQLSEEDRAWIRDRARGKRRSTGSK